MVHEFGSPEDEQEFFDASPEGDPAWLAVAFAAEVSAEAAKAWEQVPHAVNLTMCTDDIEPDDVLKRGHSLTVLDLDPAAGGSVGTTGSSSR